MGNKAPEPARPEPRITIQSAEERAMARLGEIKKMAAQHEKRALVLEKRVQRERQAALEAKRSGNIERARQMLRKAKMTTRMANASRGGVHRLNRLIGAIESQISAKGIVQALADATEMAGRLNREVDVDKVHDLMDDASEQVAVAGEVEEAIGDDTVDTGIDNDELDAALGALMAEDDEEEVGEEAEKKGTKDRDEALQDILRDMPSVPTERPEVPKEEEEEEDEETAALRRQLEAM